MDSQSGFNFTSGLDSNLSALNISRWKLGEEVNGPVLATFVALELTLSVPSNFFILIYTPAYGKKSYMKSSTVFLFCLALSNITMSLLYMPFVVIAAASEEWVFGGTDFMRQALCQFHGFLFIYLLSVSVHILALLSVDRFLSIVKPEIHQKFLTWKTSVGIMVIIGVRHEL